MSRAQGCYKSNGRKELLPQSVARALREALPDQIEGRHRGLCPYGELYGLSGGNSLVMDSRFRGNDMEGVEKTL